MSPSGRCCRKSRPSSSRSLNLGNNRIRKAGYLYQNSAFWASSGKMFSAPAPQNRFSTASVKSRHCVDQSRCPLYPQKRTCRGNSWMSALCQKRTFTSSPPPGGTSTGSSFTPVDRPCAYLLCISRTLLTGKVLRHLQSWRFAALDRSGARGPLSAQRYPTGQRRHRSQRQYVMQGGNPATPAMAFEPMTMPRHNGRRRNERERFRLAHKR